MKALITAFLVLVATVASAQTTVIGRVGTDRGAYHYVEVIQQAGEWIGFDGGYIDYNKPKAYREVYAGAGHVLLKTDRVSVIGVGFLDSASGSDADGALHAIPWVLINASLTPRIATETNFFVYMPLNAAGQRQYVLEHAKADYSFSRFAAGVGYASYQNIDNAYANKHWSSRPFVSLTVKTGVAGDVEFWIQKIDQGSSLQIRLIRVF